MPAAFIPNPGFLDDWMAEGDTIDGLVAVMESAAELARDVAPVDEGDYRDSIKVVAAGGAVFLMATDWKAAFIEWGTANNPVFAPLRRGVLGVGLRLEETKAP